MQKPLKMHAELLDLSRKVVRLLFHHVGCHKGKVSGIGYKATLGCCSTMWDVIEIVLIT
jgi:hypothetical protein